MKFCPYCGTEVTDEARFCPVCGATFAAEASVQVPQQPVPAGRTKGQTTGIIIALVAVIAAAILFGATVLPGLIATDTYTVTVKADNISVSDPTGQFMTDSRGEIEVYLDLTCSLGSSSAENKDMTWKVRPDGTIATDSKIAVFEVKGDPKDISFTLFLMIRSPSGSGYDDYADIYDDTPNISGDKPSYIGYSGIIFTMSDLNDGKIVMKGDSDPIGTVTLTITYVKK